MRRGGVDGLLREVSRWGVAAPGDPACRHGHRRRTCAVSGNGYPSIERCLGVICAEPRSASGPRAHMHERPAAAL